MEWDVPGSVDLLEHPRVSRMHDEIIGKIVTLLARYVDSFISGSLDGLHAIVSNSSSSLRLVNLSIEIAYSSLYCILFLHIKLLRYYYAVICL